MTPATRERLTSSRALIGGPALAIAFGIVIAIAIMVLGDGWDYYRTSLRVRGYHPAHKLLRPSGLGGHSLGITGTLIMACTLFYVARRRLRFMSKWGTIPRWLEVHVFFGVFGPILITMHTSFKFNGLISVAYWSMALVVVSGFVGRSLYIRIPKTLRGHELSRAEVEQRIGELKAELVEADIPPALHAHLDQIDHPAQTGRAWRRLREEAAFRREMHAAGVDAALVSRVIALARERTQLMSNIARLERRRKLFQIWHVFHRPLVWVMFLILFVHVAVAIWLGYTIFG